MPCDRAGRGSSALRVVMAAVGVLRHRDHGSLCVAEPWMPLQLEGQGLQLPGRELRRMECVNDLDRFASYSIHDPVGGFYELAYAGPLYRSTTRPELGNAADGSSRLRIRLTLWFAASSDSVEMRLWISASDRRARFDHTPSPSEGSGACPGSHHSSTLYPRPGRQSLPRFAAVPEQVERSLPT